MTGTIEEDCPVYNSSDSSKEQFATAKVAEHSKEKARRNEIRQELIDTHTTSGTLPEIREALAEHSRPR